MKPVFIIGYMGCGKTTFGKALAGFTGLRFVDLDTYIEQKEGKKFRRFLNCRAKNFSEN